MATLIPRGEAEAIWEAAERLGHPDDAQVGGCNVLNKKYVEATGRAICRACGHKIAKGELAIELAFSSGGTYNPWAAVDCYIHAKRCL
jgi:hypothetical protein